MQMKPNAAKAVPGALPQDRTQRLNLMSSIPKQTKKGAP